MSIASVCAAAAAAGPTSAAGDSAAVAAGGVASAWAVLFWAVWAVLGLAAAAALGAFRRAGIVGPERMAGDESAWPLLGILLGAFGTLILGQMAGGWVLATVARQLHEPPSPDVYRLVAGGIGESAALIVMLLLLADRRPRLGGLAAAGLSPRRLPVAVGGGTAALFILMPLVVLAGQLVEVVNRLLRAPPIQPHAILQMLRADHDPTVAVLGIVTAVLIAPAAEEVFFRGVMQTMFARAFTRLVSRGAAAMPSPDAWPHTPAAARWAAVLVTSACFAAAHGRVQFFPIYVLSVGLGFVYERSGNLYMNAATHALFNASQIVVFLSGPGR